MLKYSYPHQGARSIEGSIANHMLNDLIEATIDGEEVILLVDNLPIAKIMPLEVRKRRPVEAGSAKGLVWMSEYFDEPLLFIA